MTQATTQNPAEVAYRNQRAQLVMKMAQGIDVTSEIETLDTNWQATQKAQSLANDVAAAEVALSKQAAQSAALEAYNSAFIALSSLVAAANDAASQAEASFTQARTDLQTWQQSVEAVRASMQQVLALSEQVVASGATGAWRNRLPHMVSNNDLSVQIVKHAGQAMVQQILWQGTYPRLAS